MTTTKTTTSFTDIEKLPSPCYVIEEALLEKNLILLKHISNQSGAKVLCALKGFAMWNMFYLLQHYLHGATASSLHEAKLCFEEMHCKAHLCAPVYIEEEFDELTNISSHITFNSLSQFLRFKERALSKFLKIALRINPECSQAPTDMYDPCMHGSRLGITRNEMGEKLPNGVTGLHFHALCEQSAEALECVLNSVEEKYGDLLHHVSWLNIGGGHHITRKGYNVALLIKLVKHLINKYNLEVIIEPGEAVGWETGYLVATVQDIVTANAIKTAILNISFATHTPDCLEMPYKPKVWGEVSKERGKYKYRMGGMSCLAGDFIGDYFFEHKLKRGDRIVFDDMIHYTMVKNTTFNGINLPSIGVKKTDNSFDLIKSFGYEDYKNRLS